MSRLALITVLAVCLIGCASTQRRAMNSGERTVLTAEVRELVESQGEVDVRFVDEMHCERIRMVGTHLIKRFCYHGPEARKEARDAMRRFTNGITVGSCNNGCGSGGARATEGRGSGGNF